MSGLTDTAITYSEVSQARAKLDALIVTRRVLDMIAGTPRNPSEFDFEADIASIPEGPQCNDCVKPLDDRGRGKSIYFEFDTYADLQKHRDEFHGRTKKRTTDFKEPSKMSIQIALHSTELPCYDAKDEQVKAWEDRLKNYLNTYPPSRIKYTVNNHSRNLSPLEDPNVDGN